MCGISGIINFNNKPDSSTVEKMNNQIQYRGPNHSSVSSNSFSSIGIVRLSIIDLTEKSNQPFLDKERKISIIFNGEIYNFIELKKKYFSNIHFKSNGDGEVLLHLYKKFGISFIDKVKGMFSICICDEKINKTFLIRDRFGIKPLYFHLNNDLGELTFCSEIPGIFINKKIKKDLNYSEVHNIVTNGLIDSNENTCFKNIHQLLPGSFIEFSSFGLKQKKYYNLEEKIDEDKDNEQFSFKYYTSELKKKLINSFKQHTTFDVNGGIHLSGGSDSSIMAALTNLTNKKLNTYTFDYEHKQFSEIEEAKKLALSANIKNESSIMLDSELEKNLFKVIETQYEPFSSLRILCQNHLYEKFKNDSKVILDGSGGDEIGAGYRYYLIPWYLDMLNESNANPSRRLFSILGKHESLNKSEFILGSLAYYFKKGTATQDGSMTETLNILNKDFINKFKDNKPNLTRPFKSHLRNAQYEDFTYVKLPRSLRYTDRNSMRNSVEARLPLLDHEVVEWCYQIPSRFKFLYSQDRIILKEPFKNNINKKILFKNKRTIADPQTYWLKKTLRPLIEDTINSSSFLSNDLFNQKKLINYYNNFKNEKAHINSSFFIKILLTEWWRKKVLNS